MKRLVVITLGPAKEVDPTKDELGRTEVGFGPSMSQQDLYEAARGCWKFDRNRLSREDSALVVGDGIVRAGIEIERIVPYGDRCAIEGRILRTGDSIFDAYVGKPSPVPSGRNPIRYYTPVKKCACGCGGDTTNDFLPGHDQRAIHSRIARQFRSVADFIRWFDAQFPA